MAIIITKEKCLLEFGGDIGVGATSIIHKQTNNEYATVAFDNLEECKEIGSKTGGKTSMDDSVFMIFSKIESIDVVIKKLNEAKEILKLIEQDKN